MRVPVIKASNAVNIDGVQISKRAKRFVERFREAFDLDAEQDVIANRVYEIHLELAGDHETYLEVGDALGPTLRRALHTYVSLKWKER